MNCERCGHRMAFIVDSFACVQRGCGWPELDMVEAARCFSDNDSAETRHVATLEKEGYTEAERQENQRQRFNF